MTYPAFAGGKWIVWTPLPGLDVSLGERAMLVGAAVYAQCISEKGMSEEKSHQLAKASLPAPSSPMLL